jgi:glucokinase
MNKTFVLGLDLGGTKIAAGVVDSSGRVLSALRIPTPAKGVRQDLAALFDAARSAVGAAGVPWKSVHAVGVGVPGAFDPKTRTVWAPNLPGWKRVPLESLLGRALRKPVFVEGDRNVQALAEAWLVHPHVRNLVFLTVGTGIGAGIIVDGRVVSGSRGVAGAAGWMAIERKWQTRFARIGSLEALGAGPAVARLAREAARKNPRSAIGTLLRSGQRLSAEQVVLAARRGDRTARRVLEEVGSNLGRGVAGIISLLNPEIVVLGGGLAGAGHLILDPLRTAARRWGQPLASSQVRIARSALGEDAGILGAARYALLEQEA